MTAPKQPTANGPWPSLTLNLTWALVASVPLDLGQNHTRKRATNNWRVIPAACVRLILVLFIYEYKCRPGPLGNAKVGFGWICLLGSYNLRKHSCFPPPRTEGRKKCCSCRVKCSRIRKCRAGACLCNFPALSRCQAFGRPGVAGDPVV